MVVFNYQYCFDNAHRFVHNATTSFAKVASRHPDFRPFSLVLLKCLPVAFFKIVYLYCYFQLYLLTSQKCL